jgi:hypothetical protein
MLVPGGYSNRTVLKRRLIKADILRNECYECGQRQRGAGSRSSSCSTTSTTA